MEIKKIFSDKIDKGIRKIIYELEHSDIPLNELNVLLHIFDKRMEYMMYMHADDYQLLRFGKPRMPKHKSFYEMLYDTCDNERLNKLFGFMKYKNVSNQHGLPDLMALTAPGKIEFIEVKVGGDFLKPNQIMCITQLNKMNYDTSVQYFLRNVSDFENFSTNRENNRLSYETTEKWCKLSRRGGG